MDISYITYSVFIPLLINIHDMSKSIGLESFGWSIVILTALVKLLLTPLTYKQIKSTKQMQVVQPKLKKIQDDFKKLEERLKDTPEKLQKARTEFQQKMMNFYKENEINPLGGCLPLLIQMPILLGLFWTFSGSPFADKAIQVNVKVVSQAQESKRVAKPATKAEIFVDENGHKGRYMLNVKSLTLVEGEEYTLKVSRSMGDSELDLKELAWNFFGKNQDSEHVEIIAQEDGSAIVRALKAGGSAKVQANLPAKLEGDHFLFIKSFGSSGVFDAKTGSLNFDVLILVLLFGFSIFLSSRLNAPKTAPVKAGETEDPQVAMQKSMSTMMPVMMTGMMFFIPLPAGAFVYMIVSSFIQSGQTYFAMQRYNKKFNL